MGKHEGTRGNVGGHEGHVGVTLGAAPAGREVTVNGVAVRPPKVFGGSGLSLQRAGLFLLLLTRLGVAVLWDGGETPGETRGGPGGSWGWPCCGAEVRPPGRYG